jgi:uncharacterized protein with ParB-like and HNH nuclease domain
MSFQTPITIAEALENIEQNRYLLPAIQREFEWPSHKIEWLFDSLMRGYPISSFLFWNVENGSGPSYKFYRFLRDYRQRYKIHNEDANIDGNGNFTAILDGQQRLTSLYIGLKGSYAYKEKHRHWNDDEWSVPTRHLFLNIKRTLDDQEEEDGRIYEFSFLKREDTGSSDIHKGEWFRVGKILDLRNIGSFNTYVSQQGLDEDSINILARLHEVVFSDRVVNYFLEKEQDLHKALNIFIRINSGGKPLDFSDLIMSIAIANWKAKDARQEIHKLVDRILEMGFSISKDFIFKAYLYLYSKDIRFKVTNFSTENAHNFEKDWERIRDAIQASFDLARSFGFTDQTLVSKNTLIPVIYYLYHRGIYRDFVTAVRFREDRERIKRWIHVMTIKRIFGAGSSDGILSQIRRGFTSDVTGTEKVPPGIEAYPVKEIDTEIRRDTSVGEEFVEDLLTTQMENRYAFSILALLYPNLDYRNGDFHKDHVHPRSGFSESAIAQLDLSKEQRERFMDAGFNNSIINLQMLDSNENKAKREKTLAAWVGAECVTKDRDQFLARCLIPAGVSLEFKDFSEFAEKRASLLKGRLLELLSQSGTSVDSPA